MTSITIDQWRCRIGAFSGNNVSTNPIALIETKRIELKKHGHVLLILSMVLVYANILQILLVKAGIEPNPGPNQREVLGKSLFFKFTLPFLIPNLKAVYILNLLLNCSMK